MAYPADVVTRTVTIGDSVGLPTGDALSITAYITASRGLIWAATGTRMPLDTEVSTAVAGGVVTVSLPVCDQSGYRDEATGGVIDISVPGSVTHTYSVTLITQTGAGRQSQIIPPFALPTGDLSPVDIDTLLPTTTVAGGVVQVPDSWDARVAAAEAVTATITPAGLAITSAADAATQRTALGLGSGALATAGAPTARAEPPTRPTWLTTFQPGHGWTDKLSSGTLADDTDPGDFIMGTQSVRVIDSTVEKSALALDLTDRHLVVRLRVNSYTAGHAVSIYAHSGTWANFMLWEVAGTPDAEHRWFQSGEWVYLTLPWEGGVATGSPNRATIDTIRIRPVTLGDINVQGVGHAPAGAQAGRVSFTFDDGYDSWLTLAAPTLAKYGIAGTGYIIPDFDNDPGYLSAADCRVLQDMYGWDMEMHGDNDLSTLTAAQMREEWSRGKRWFHANGLGNADHIAYPYGQTDAEVVATAREFFTSGRTISYGKALESWPPGMPYRLRAVSGISSAAGGSNVAAVKALIDKAVASGQWLVLVFHVIGATASTTMTCTTADLDEIAAYAAASGAQIQTVADAMR